MQKYPIQPIVQAIDIPEELDRNQNYKVVRIGDNWFSYTQKGESIYFHLFSKEPKTLSDSCELFINWLFSEHEWCKMLIITLNKNSLYKLAKKHKFETILHSNNKYFMARCR